MSAEQSRLVIEAGLSSERDLNEDPGDRPGSYYYSGG